MKQRCSCSFTLLWLFQSYITLYDIWWALNFSICYSPDKGLWLIYSCLGNGILLMAKYNCIPLLFQARSRKTHTKASVVKEMAIRWVIFMHKNLVVSVLVLSCWISALNQFFFSFFFFPVWSAVARFFFNI